MRLCSILLPHVVTIWIVGHEPGQDVVPQNSVVLVLVNAGFRIKKEWWHSPSIRADHTQDHYLGWMLHVANPMDLLTSSSNPPVMRRLRNWWSLKIFLSELIFTCDAFADYFITLRRTLQRVSWCSLAPAERGSLGHRPSYVSSSPLPGLLRQPR